MLKPGQVFACYEWCLTPKCVLRCIDRLTDGMHTYMVVCKGHMYSCIFPHPRASARYDKGNAAHRLIKKQIEEGDGLPDTAYTWEMDEALQKVLQLNPSTTFFMCFAPLLTTISSARRHTQPRQTTP